MSIALNEVNVGLDDTFSQTMSAAHDQGDESNNSKMVNVLKAFSNITPS